MVAIKPIREWSGAPGRLVSWHPTPASRAKLAAAPVSSAPASFQQAQHIRSYLTHLAAGTEMARLNIPAWDMPGRCDLRAMTHVINAYLRRHDTYHSWFELGEGANIVRRTAASPKDITVAATQHGEVTAAQWREHVLGTAGPLQWDCFHFGIIQRDDHFTFYISVDHLHTDAMFMGLVLIEIHMMYAALAGGERPIPLPEAGRYHDYCTAQRAHTDALTLQSPEVADWIDFAHDNGGSMPRFPLPLGDPTVPCSGDLITVRLLDREQAESFEAACQSAGARFIGGVFAAVALADRDFTDADTYHVITPTTTRATPADFLTTGWYTGVVPVTVEVDGDSFGRTARAAQESFDSRQRLAHVPYDRVLELAAGSLGLRQAGAGVPMVSYLDAGLPPLSPAVIEEWERLNGAVYSDARLAYQVGMWVNRGQHETTVTVAFPDNPVARESIARYLISLQATFAAAAERTHLVPVTTGSRLDALRARRARDAVAPARRERLVPAADRS